MKAAEWRKLRSEVDHDWLKNVYLPALDTWLNLLDGLVTDREMERSYLAKRFLNWDRYSPELERLRGQFQLAMSPAGRFEAAPLLHCPACTRDWLLPLSLSLWRFRHGVQEHQADLDRAVSEAGEAYRALRDTLEREVDGDAARVSIRHLRPQFVLFRDRCVEVGKAISRLPHSAGPF